MTMTLASPTQLLAIAQPAAYSTKQEKMPKALSIVPSQKDTFSVKPRKTEKGSEEKVQPQSLGKQSLIPIIVAGALGLSALAMGIYILVQRNELSQLVEKNKRDEAKIKDLKEQLTKAIATAEEHLKKLQEPVPLSAISDIIDKAIEDIPQIESDADGYQEYFSNSIRVLTELKKHKPTWQALQEAIEKLKETVQRLEAEKNKPTT